MEILHGQKSMISTIIFHYTQNTIIILIIKH